MFLVGAVSLLASAPALAEYDPTHGRFLQRDPKDTRPDIALPHTGDQYSDSMNLYEFAGANPVANVDPYGLEWKVERKWGRRAVAECDCRDTVRDLAKKTNMDPDQFVLWLKPIDGGKRPKGPDQPIMRNGTFSIPNQTVVIVGNMNRIARAATGRTPANAAQILQGKGFAVSYLDFRWIGPFTSGNITSYGYDLYGLIYFGHGLSPSGSALKKKSSGKLPWGKDPLAGSLDISGAAKTGYVGAGLFYDGQFGLLVLKSCFAGRSWPPKLSENGAAWFGCGFEAAGVDYGLLNTVRQAK